MIAHVGALDAQLASVDDGIGGRIFGDDLESVGVGH
jgi:hypothetical protein